MLRSGRNRFEVIWGNAVGLLTFRLSADILHSQLNQPSALQTLSAMGHLAIDGVNTLGVGRRGLTAPETPKKYMCCSPYLQNRYFKAHLCVISSISMHPSKEAACCWCLGLGPALLFPSKQFNSQIAICCCSNLLHQNRK